MSTVNKVLIGVLVAQVVLALIVHTRTDAIETIRRPEPLLPGLDAAQIQRVAIFKARDPDDEGAAVDQPAIELRRGGSGNSSTWTLSSHWGHPVRAGAGEELAGKLAALETTGPVITSDVRHGQLEVTADHYRRKLVIETADGTTRVLFVGKPSRARQSFVRIDGQDQVHAVSDISESGLDVLPSGWIEPTFLLLQPSEVAYMSVRNPNGFFEFQRNENDRWTLVSDGAPYPIPPGKKFNAPAADNWVKDMLRLTMTEPADPNRKIDTPLATVTIRMKTQAPDTPSTPDDPAAPDAPAAPDVPAVPDTASEEPVEHVIEIGAKEGDVYYVRMAGKPHAAMIRSSRVPVIIGIRDEFVLIPGGNQP
jgi:hypothetical protein